MGRALRILSLTAAFLVACGGTVERSTIAYGAADYVGSEECALCHAEQASLWNRSDHARAMEIPTPESVLGDFEGATFAYGGVKTTFFRRVGRYFVSTDGPDGEVAEFPIAYTFGVDPLQQYLIPFPGGRYQVLGIAWDSRPESAGGHRWFHLYPDQVVAAGDRLHWTSDEQTWNYQCADCHSTDLVRGYDLTEDAYETTFEEIDVSCEACHGPGSRHVTWGREEEPSGDPQLVIDLRRPDGAWTWEGTSDGIARWAGDSGGDRWLGACAPCHSRRRSIANGPDPAANWLDLYQPALLTEGLYYPDGQIRDEVYVWGSFVQSRMYAAGVRCDDCHDPHSTRLLAEGNALCATCHLPAAFDTADHLRHEAGTPGSFCVDCHAPSRTYMQIDPRRDHSFRIPRPDLAEITGSPDACTGCHRDQTPEWAATRIVEWFGPTRKDPRPPGIALAAGRGGAIDAERQLIDLVGEASRPAIVRATALALLGQYLGPRSIATAASALGDASPLVRAAAVRTLGVAPEEVRSDLAVRALSDPSRLVRIAAAHAFVDVPTQLLGEARSAFVVAFREAVAAELATAERPESHLNLSVLYAEQGDIPAAERELGTALELDPASVAARVDLADLARARGRDEEARSLLEEAVALEPDNAAAVHALGLLEVRSGRSGRALELLAEASELDPGNTRFAYVYGVALYGAGRTDKALRVLEEAHRARPADRDVLVALATYSEESGKRARARRWVELLLELSPGDRRLADWLQRLEAGAG